VYQHWFVKLAHINSPNNLRNIGVADIFKISSKFINGWVVWVRFCCCKKVSFKLNIGGIYEC